MSPAVPDLGHERARYPARIASYILPTGILYLAGIQAGPWFDCALLRKIQSLLHLGAPEVRNYPAGRAVPVLHLDPGFQGDHQAQDRLKRKMIKFSCLCTEYRGYFKGAGIIRTTKFWNYGAKVISSQANRF